MRKLKEKMGSISDDRQQRITVLAALIILCIVFSVGSRYFLIQGQ